MDFDKKVRRRRVLGGIILPLAVGTMIAALLYSYNWRDENVANKVMDYLFIAGTALAAFSTFKLTIDTTITGKGTLEKRMLCAALLEDLAGDSPDELKRSLDFMIQARKTIGGTGGGLIKK